jgi:hypothetical protein
MPPQRLEHFACGCGRSRCVGTIGVVRVVSNVSTASYMALTAQHVDHRSVDAGRSSNDELSRSILSWWRSHWRLVIILSAQTSFPWVGAWAAITISWLASMLCVSASCEPTARWWFQRNDTVDAGLLGAANPGYAAGWA